MRTDFGLAIVSAIEHNSISFQDCFSLYIFYTVHLCNCTDYYFVFFLECRICCDNLNIRDKYDKIQYKNVYIFKQTPPPLTHIYHI